MESVKKIDLIFDSFSVWTPRRPRLRVRSGKGTILRSDLGAPPFGNGIGKVFVVVEPEEERGIRVEGARVKTEFESGNV